jgi:hypothetical protein
MVWLAWRRTPFHATMLLTGAGSLLDSVSMFFSTTSLPYRFSVPCVATGLVMTVVILAAVRDRRRVVDTNSLSAAGRCSCTGRGTGGDAGARDVKLAATPRVAGRPAAR